MLFSCRDSNLTLCCFYFLQELYRVLTVSVAAHKFVLRLFILNVISMCNWVTACFMLSECYWVTACFIVHAECYQNVFGLSMEISCCVANLRIDQLNFLSGPRERVKSPLLHLFLYFFASLLPYFFISLSFGTPFSVHTQFFEFCFFWLYIQLFWSRILSVVRWHLIKGSLLHTAHVYVFFW